MAVMACAVLILALNIWLLVDGLGQLLGSSPAIPSSGFRYVWREQECPDCWFGFRLNR